MIEHSLYPQTSEAPVEDDTAPSRAADAEPPEADAQPTAETPPASTEPEATDSRDIIAALRAVDAEHPVVEHARVDTDVPPPSWVLASDTQVIPAVPSGPVTAYASPAPPTERESITCPECGTVGTIVVSRRDAADFCANCDYPLFWTPSRVLLDRANLSDDSLRRLPGTVGRIAIASFPCPHCSEPNAVTAVDCVRCGRPLHPVRVQVPEPIYSPPPPPPPVYEPEPEPTTPWWVWLLFYLSLSGAVILVILYATGTIG